MKILTCGCKPGTEANGWHEVRSAACRKKELDLFKRAMNLDLTTAIMRR